MVDTETDQEREKECTNFTTVPYPYIVVNDIVTYKKKRNEMIGREDSVWL